TRSDRDWSSDVCSSDLEAAGAEVLRVVGPVAVGADPDLEQRRFVLEHRAAAGRRERADPRPGPDQREAVREVDLALVAGADRVRSEERRVGKEWGAGGG